LSVDEPFESQKSLTREKLWELASVRYCKKLGHKTGKAHFGDSN